MYMMFRSTEEKYLTLLLVLKLTVPVDGVTSSTSSTLSYQGGKVFMNYKYECKGQSLRDTTCHWNTNGLDKETE